MAIRLRVRATVVACVYLALTGCSTSPFDRPTDPLTSREAISVSDGYRVQGSSYRETDPSEPDQGSLIEIDATPESYIRYALFHSPVVEQAYQRWRAAAERVPQVGALPDPRLNVGFFLNELETRVGPQQSRVGLQQTFPWIGKLQDRKDQASKGALAAWYRYQQTQIEMVERVQIALYRLVYLDHAIEITDENLALLRSFEEVVRSRYRVGAGSHPELIRVQVELGQLEDRIIGLRAMRPSYVAAINALLNRAPQSSIPEGIMLPDAVVALSAMELSEMAQRSSPVLRSVGEEIEQARIGTRVARKDGYPDLTVGIDYIVTDEAANPSIPESGDDPIMLSFGINLPIWREKYDAQVRESIAHRLIASREFESQSSTLAAQIYKAWFEHTDADRRVALYEQSLIPKAQESLSASLAGFRTGGSVFLDLLDTQRTLLEFDIAAQRARSDRGQALATLSRLVGHAVPVRDALTHTSTQHSTEETQQ